MRSFLHVWITSPSMVSLSLVGNLQKICSKYVRYLHSNPSMDEEAPPRRLQAWYLTAAYKNLFLVCLSSTVHPPIELWPHTWIFVRWTTTSMESLSSLAKKICTKCIHHLHSNLFYSIQVTAECGSHMFVRWWLVGIVQNIVENTFVVWLWPIA